MLRIDLHRATVRFERAAVLRRAGGHSSAAVAAPSEHASVIEQCKRMITTAADRSNGVPRRRTGIHVTLAAQIGTQAMTPIAPDPSGIHPWSFIVDWIDRLVV